MQTFSRLLVFVSIITIIGSSITSHNNETNSSNEIHECSFYVAPSDTPGLGRGIINGKNISDGQYFEEFSSSTIVVEYESIRKWQLSNYVFGTDNESLSIAAIGLPMLFNHHKDKEYDHYWVDSWLPNEQKLSHTTSVPIALFSIKDIQGDR